MRLLRDKAKYEAIQAFVHRVAIRDPQLGLPQLGLSVTAADYQRLLDEAFVECSVADTRPHVLGFLPSRPGKGALLREIIL